MPEKLLEYGIPEKVVSGNGLQFNSAEFARFTQEYNFTHSTYSPRYPQLNGLAEWTVQTAKKTFQRQNGAIETRF